MDTTKPRMGRPPLAAKDRRDAAVRVMLTKSERKEVLAAAGADGISEWIRSIIVPAARKKNGQGFA